MAVWFPAQGFLNLPEMFLCVLKSTETVTLKSGDLVYMSKLSSVKVLQMNIH